MRQLLGTKIGMTRIFTEDGDQVSVTVVQAGPCPIVKVKTKETDGYDAVVLGYGQKRKSLYSKPHLGVFKAANIEPTSHLGELRLSEPQDLKVGDVWTVDLFKPGETVRVTGTSKGKGFQGGVRRHHFSGGSKSHGQSDRMRAPGSIGASSYPSRVFKGQRMAGHMGSDRVTVRNVKIVDVNAEKGIILLKGAVPGARNGLIVIKD